MPGRDAQQVTGIVLAGGKSERLGQNKVLLELAGRSLLARAVQTMWSLCVDVVVAGEIGYRDQVVQARFVSDIYRGVGALGGIHAGLQASHTQYGLVVGCDMPFLNPELLRHMIAQIGDSDYGAPDVVIPRLKGYTEPLHALYSRRCLGPLERLLAQGGGRIISFFSEVSVRYIEEAEVNRFDPRHRSFFNINTPEDWQRAQIWTTEEAE